MESIKNKYSNYSIYAIIKPEHFELMESNPHIHRCIPFSPQLENPLILEGSENFEGYFDIAFYPEATKKQKCIFHNGED